MRTRKQVILGVLAFLIISLAFTACNGDDYTEIRYFTVNFYGENDLLYSQNVKEGERAVKPSDPVREEYIFECWVEYRTNEEWDFSNEVTSNMNLKAKWKPDQYIIIFDNIHGTPFKQFVKKGERAVMPVEQRWPNYTFAYWYKEGTDEAWDFNTIITEEFTMKAKWYFIEMLRINAGTFTMGSPGGAQYEDNEKPQHQVTLSAFYMGKYEVTQLQYQWVTGKTPSYNKPKAYEALPVETVSWYDALVFCNTLSLREGLTPAYSIDGNTNPEDWGRIPTVDNTTWNAVAIVENSNGYRLPTEAQWEYACRAGTSAADDRGYVITNNTGWYSSNSGIKTQYVGLKLANDWNLYDMLGNVAELCWNLFGDYTDEEQTDPTGTPVEYSNRIARGEGYSSPANRVRSAYRSAVSPYSRLGSMGFRVVRP